MAYQERRWEVGGVGVQDGWVGSEVEINLVRLVYVVYVYLLYWEALRAAADALISTRVS